MRLRNCLSGVLLAVVCSQPSSALQPIAKVVTQLDAPVTISTYTATYRERTTYSSEGIHHSLEYRNSSDKVIDAVEIGLVSFDVWNEFLDQTGGMAFETVAPGGTKKGLWVASAYADFSFLTGVAYVRRVRFRDGTIWSADLDAIARELSAIESGFDVSRLKEKEKNDE